MLPGPSPHGALNDALTSTTPEFVQSKDWLVRLNEYRAAVRLQKVQEDSEWSEAAADHARYLIETYAVMLNTGHHMTLEEMHHENPTSPWYSPHAAIAAQLGDEAMFAFHLDPATMIDGWIAAPFHRPVLLLQKLLNVGYGEYCNRGMCAASFTALAMGSDDDPLAFPPDGATVALRAIPQSPSCPLGLMAVRRHF